MNEEEKTSLVVQSQELQQMDQIASTVIERVSEDREKADEAYDFMRDQIDIEGDRNPSTRDAMLKAVELKIMTTDQMIELLKIKAKMINPNKGNNININLGDYDSQKGGNTNDLISIAEKYIKKTHP